MDPLIFSVQIVNLSCNNYTLLTTFNQVENKTFTILNRKNYNFQFGLGNPIQNLFFYLQTDFNQQPQLYALFSTQLDQLSSLTITIDDQGFISTTITPVLF